jgi:hypothetical protein
MGRYAMYGRTICTLSAAALVIRLIPGSIVAQQGTLKQQLVEVALVPNNEGTEVKATATVTRDDSKLTAANVNGNKLDLVYRRAR